MRRLVAEADVVVANLPAETLKAMGLDWDSVSTINPRVILAVGDRLRTRRPLFRPRRLRRRGAGHVRRGLFLRNARTARTLGRALGRFRNAPRSWHSASPPRCGARETTGKGQMVEGALLRTALTFFSPTLIEEAALELDRKPSLNRSQTAGPSDIFKTRDGWITVAVNGDPLFRRARQADRGARMARGSALCERQVARRSRRDHQRARAGVDWPTHQRRRDRCL